ncbi:MAG TPA: hypothetical protein VM325_19320 [Alphaproteobacteria bacterium]|nr:hypothetical protein [Alphaproteobacteria bacterium]
MSRCIARRRLALAFLLAGVFVSPAHAKDGWHGAERPGARALFYGEVPPTGRQPNPETIQLILRCADKGRAIVVFVAETSAKLKPGRALRVLLSVAGVRSAAMGRTTANQLAGVPSLRATLPLHARVFAAMTEPRTLHIQAGGWQRSLPLNGLGGRLKRLTAGCRK